MKRANRLTPVAGTKPDAIATAVLAELDDLSALQRARAAGLLKPVSP